MTATPYPMMQMGGGFGDSLYRRRPGAAMQTPQTYGGMISGAVAQTTGSDLGGVITQLAMNALAPAFSNTQSMGGMSASQFQRGSRLRAMDRDMTNYANRVDSQRLDGSANTLNGMLGTDLNGRQVKNGLQWLEQIGSAAGITGLADIRGGNLSDFATKMNRVGTQMTGGSGTQGLSRGELEDVVKTVSTVFQDEKGMARLDVTKGFTMNEIGDMSDQLQQRNMLQFDPTAKEGVGSQLTRQLMQWTENASILKDLIGNPDAGIPELFATLESALGPGLAKMRPEKVKSLLADVNALSSVTGIDGQMMLGTVGSLGQTYAREGASAEAGMASALDAVRRGSAAQRMIGRGADMSDARTAYTADDVQRFSADTDMKMAGSNYVAVTSMLKDLYQGDDSKIKDKRLAEFKRDPTSAASRAFMDDHEAVVSAMAGEAQMDPGAVQARMRAVGSNLANLTDDERRTAQNASAQQNLLEASKLVMQNNPLIAKAFGDDPQKLATMYEQQMRMGKSGQQLIDGISEEAAKLPNADPRVNGNSLQSAMDTAFTDRDENFGLGMSPDKFRALTGYFASAEEAEKIREEEKVTAEVQASLQKNGSLQAMTRGGKAGMQVLASMIAAGDPNLDSAVVLDTLMGAPNADMVKKIYNSDEVKKIVEQGAEAESLIQRLDKAKKLEDDIAEQKSLMKLEGGDNAESRAQLQKMEQDLADLNVTEEDKKGRRNAELVMAASAKGLANLPTDFGAVAKLDEFQSDAREAWNEDEQKKYNELKDKALAQNATEGDKKRFLEYMRGVSGKFDADSKHSDTEFLDSALNKETGQDYRENVQAPLQALSQAIDDGTIDTPDKLLQRAESFEDAMKGVTSIGNTQVVSQQQAMAKITKDGGFMLARDSYNTTDEQVRDGAAGMNDAQREAAAQKRERDAVAVRLASGAGLSSMERGFLYNDEDQNRYDELTRKKEGYKYLDKDGNERTVKPRISDEEEAELTRAQHKRKFLLGQVNQEREAAGKAAIDENDSAAVNEALKGRYGKEQDAVLASNEWRKETMGVTREELIAENARMKSPTIDKVDPNAVAKGSSGSEGGKTGGGGIDGDAVIHDGQNNRSVRQATIVVRYK